MCPLVVLGLQAIMVKCTASPSFSVRWIWGEYKSAEGLGLRTPLYSRALLRFPSSGPNYHTGYRGMCTVYPGRRFLYVGLESEEWCLNDKRSNLSVIKKSQF